MQHRFKFFTILTSLSLLIISMCSFQAQSITKKGKWLYLFDGKSLNEWHSYNQDRVIGWFIEDGMLTTDGSGGDLTTNKEFGDFDLQFEFKIPPASNSGVFYKVIEKPEIKRTVHSGPEYQIIDDTGYIVKDAQGNVIPLKETQKTAANYEMDPPLTDKGFKPAGTWNVGRIVVKGDHVKHFLNNKLIVEYHYGSADWLQKVKAGKYADLPYATPHHMGRIALQSHNAKEKMWFRSIKIKEL